MFKELFEAKASLKDAQKELKKNGEVHITMGKTDTWANIDDIIDGIGYGFDQFDNDIEINFKKDNFTIVESNRINVGDIFKNRNGDKVRVNKIQGKNTIKLWVQPVKEYKADKGGEYVVLVNGNVGEIDWDSTNRLDVIIK